MCTACFYILESQYNFPNVQKNGALLQLLNFYCIPFSTKGTICFFLDTTPSKKALLFFNSTCLLIISLLFPNTKISELLFRISVITKTNKSKPSSFIFLFIFFYNLT